ncbi:MAG: type II toxin-antitoxin system VapC family toxin [Planctomycetia bacterium]|nr:type II toxin-antitoxin system VapC family toxin [Planctomycetia bacterium]
MGAWFLDSSAIVKADVQEPGSAWVGSLLGAPAEQLVAARVMGAEVTSMLARALKGLRLTPAQHSVAAAAFRFHFYNRLIIIELTPLLVDAAMTLAEKHALRGYDSIQLAAVLAAQQVRAAAGTAPLTFVSSDAELNRVAMAEGLAVDDPANHP